MKVNTFAGFEQFALSTQEVAMVKGGVFCFQYADGTSKNQDYSSVKAAISAINEQNEFSSNPVVGGYEGPCE